MENMFSVKVIDVNAFGGEVVFSGIPQYYVDRSGHIGILNVAKMGMHTSMMLTLGGGESLADNMRFFTVQHSLKISKDFYSETENLRKSVIAVKKQTGLPKTSSKGLVTTFKNMKGKELVQCVMTHVLCDIKSRRPIPIPITYKNKYNETVCFKEDTLQKLNISVDKDSRNPPTNAFRTTIRTHFSDTDFNNHVNQAEYFRYFMDCASEAATSGYYTHFNVDMCWYPVLEAEIFYLGESLAAETLNATTWQDTNDLQVINFSLNRWSKCVALGVMKFSLEKHKANTNSVL